MNHHSMGAPQPSVPPCHTASETRSRREEKKSVKNGILGKEKEKARKKRLLNEVESCCRTVMKRDERNP